MNQQYLYLVIDLACISIPLLASFHPKIKFYREFPFVIPAIAFVASIFLLWDEWFTRIGVWGFNKDYVMGVFWGELPLEEILFFVCIPYACVFTFFCVEKLWPNHPLFKQSNALSLFFLVFSLLLGLTNYSRLYTVITFLGLFLSIILYWLLFKNKGFATLVFSYLLIAPFFLISNGLLTGTGIANEVVWYNDQENLGRRIGTIPFEDFFYGFLLILLNVIMYKLLKQWRASRLISVDLNRQAEK